MPKKSLSDTTKKNLLDLDYNKHLQYYNTSIILLFTYVIGTFIAFLTKQIDYKNLNQLFLFIVVSISFIVPIIIFMRKSKEQLRDIPKEIKKLKL